MTEDTNVDSEGAGGATNPPVSSTPVEGNAVEMSKLVKQVVDEALKPIKGDISGLYSRQDKDRNELGEFMAEFKKQKGKGLDDEAAEIAAQNVFKEREEREQERAWREAVSRKLGLVSNADAGNEGNGANETAKVFDEYGISPNDADAVPLLSLQGKDLELALSKLALKRAKQQRDPSEAGSINNQKPTQSNDVAALTNNYIKDMKAARGRPSELKRIREEARKNGVDVYNIDFS